MMSRIRMSKDIRHRFRFSRSKEYITACLYSVVKYYVEVDRRGKLEESEEFEKRMYTIADWLCNQDGKVGMMFMGGCGNGKTTLLKAIQYLAGQSELKYDEDKDSYLRIESAKRIVDISKSERSWSELINLPLLAIDDLGQEPTEVLEFGNVKSPLVDLFSHRYNEQLFTIVTTNLDPSELKQKYGTRIADRFREMMDKIIFEDESYRK